MELCSREGSVRSGTLGAEHRAATTIIITIYVTPQKDYSGTSSVGERRFGCHCDTLLDKKEGPNLLLRYREKRTRHSLFVGRLTWPVLGLGGVHLPEEMDTRQLALEGHCWPNGSEPPTASRHESKQRSSCPAGEEAPSHGDLPRSFLNSVNSENTRAQHPSQMNIQPDWGVLQMQQT